MSALDVFETTGLCGVVGIEPVNTNPVTGCGQVCLTSVTIDNKNRTDLFWFKSGSPPPCFCRLDLFWFPTTLFLQNRFGLVPHHPFSVDQICSGSPPPCFCRLDLFWFPTTLFLQIRFVLFPRHPVSVDQIHSVSLLPCFYKFDSVCFPVTLFLQIRFGGFYLN